MVTLSQCINFRAPLKLLSLSFLSIHGPQVVALLGVLGAAAGLPLLDPLAGLAVAGMVATTGIHVAWDALRELTDTVSVVVAMYEIDPRASCF